MLRAIDAREILMRVVIDARSGAISAVNRFVSARPDGVTVKKIDRRHHRRRPERRNSPFCGEAGVQLGENRHGRRNVFASLGKP